MARQASDITAAIGTDLERMRAGIVLDALDRLRLEARLREWTDHAAERAPFVAAWWKGRKG